MADINNGAVFVTDTPHWLSVEGRQNLIYGYSFQEVEKRLSYGSFVGDKLNYIFMETPKAACSSLKWIISDLENRQVQHKHCGYGTQPGMVIHARASHGIKNLMQVNETERLRLIIDNQVTRFCVVRNPYARLASAWADKIRQKEPNYEKVWLQVAKHCNTDPSFCPTFSQFVRWLVDTQQPDKCNAHWRGMSYLLLPELLSYTHVLHTENLVDELDAVLRLIAPTQNASELLKKHRTNESLPMDWKACYDEETAKRVADFYKTDFERYGYSLDSWKSKAETISLADENKALREQLRRYETSALEAVRARNDVIFELINNKTSNPVKTKPVEKKSILVLGDSHSRIFKQKNWRRLTPKLSWNAVCVEGATVSGLTNPNSKTQAGNYFAQALSEHQAKVILLCLGEVDTGFVIWYRSEKHGIDVQQAAQLAVDNYCRLIEAARQRASTIVLSAPLPTLQDNCQVGAVAKARSSIKASQQQRTELTCWFNKEIQNWCIKNNINYVNIDPLSKGADGLVDPQLRHPDPKNHHYDPESYQKLLVEQLLPVIRNMAR